MLPLFFQVILLDSASKAGARLVIPSLATPIGGLISGIIMSRWGKLAHLVRAGAFLMFIGNVLVMLLGFDDARWKYFVYVVPANLGQGIVYPAILFTFLAAFDHSGTFYHPDLLCDSSETRKLTLRIRPCRLRLDGLSHPLPRHCLGRRDHIYDSSKPPQCGLTRCPEWST